MIKHFERLTLIIRHSVVFEESEKTLLSIIVGLYSMVTKVEGKKTKNN